MTHSTTRPDEPPQTSSRRRPPPAEVGNRANHLPVRTLLLGLLGALALLSGGVGAGGVLVGDDPLLGSGPLSVLRYGHGQDMATAVVYLGLGFLVWAWIRLGRDVLAGLARGRAVLVCAAAWAAPLLAAPPLFTRDVYVYLAQGALALHGFDPYAVGPEVMRGPLTDNVHYMWQATSSPYGPLFLLLAKGVVAVTGNSVVSGVILMRLALLPGLVLLVWALPGLVRHLGGRTSVALWVAVANPLTVTQLVGGPHNDILMIGLLACGALLVLNRRHAAGFAVVGVAVAIKATAGVALPFLVLIWAARLPGSRWSRVGKAAAAAIALVVPIYLAADWALGVRLTELPALSDPSLIVDWLSVPTGAGQAVYSVVSWVADVDQQQFIATARILGIAALLVAGARYWWAAREGGVVAVRQMAVVLALTATLAPTTLPWYFTWALAMAAALRWSPLALALVVCGSVWLLVVDYPTGDIALYNWPYLGAGAVMCLLAAASLRHPHPLRLLGGTLADRLGRSPRSVV